MCIARYTLAVDRRGKKQEGQPTADFISCVAFKSNAEFAEKYLRQGTKIAVEGRIQTGSYKNKDGQTVYTTDVVIDSQEFCEGKKETQDTAPSIPEDKFVSIPDNVDMDLPFN
jgi:single-strand DNA-binding protein